MCDDYGVFCINCDSIIDDGSKCDYCDENYCSDCLVDCYCSEWCKESDAVEVNT